MEFDKERFTVFLKAGLPFTLIGVIVVFGGLYFIKRTFSDSEYLTVILFGWLALFWFVYQPLFRKRIKKEKDKYRS